MLLLHPDEEFTVTDLSRRLRVPVSTLHPEAARLVSAGLLDARDVGHARLLRAGTHSRLVAPLTDLVALAFGPRAVVEEEFGELDGADTVLIYGSWAARYTGEPGQPPADIDVMIVGRPDRDAVYAAADRAERRIAYRVEPVIASPERWERAADPLVQQIRSAPYTVVIDHTGRRAADAVGDGCRRHRASPPRWAPTGRPRCAGRRPPVARQGEENPRDRSYDRGVRSG